MTAATLPMSIFLLLTVKMPETAAETEEAAAEEKAAEDEADAE